MSQNLLEVEGLSKKFCRFPKRAMGYAAADLWHELSGRGRPERLRPDEFWALQDVSFQLAPGEVLGVIGHNGAGKSTLIQILSGVILPTCGQLRFFTEDIVHMEHYTNLDGFESGRDNIRRLLFDQNFRTTQVEEAIGSICEWAQLEQLIDAPVASYSLGTKTRLSFALYAQMKPALFIVDEALYGGDVRFQARFRDFLLDYIREGGSMLFCSHDLFTLQTLSHRVLLLEEGRVTMLGEPASVLARYLTPSATTPAPLETELACQGDIRIESLTLTPAHSGRPLTLELVCQSPQAYPEITWALEIGSGQVPAVATLKGGYQSLLSVLPGRNHFRCQIEKLPLAPGSYQLRTALVHRSSGAVLGWKGFQCPPETLQVEAEVTEATNVMRLRGNVVYLEGSFERVGG